MWWTKVSLHAPEKLCPSHILYPWLQNCQPKVTDALSQARAALRQPWKPQPEEEGYCCRTATGPHGHLQHCASTYPLAERAQIMTCSVHTATSAPLSPLCRPTHH